MKDLNTDAWRTAKIAESGIYNAWKALAPFSKILGEAIQQQTNTIDKTAANLDNQSVLSKEVLPVQTEIGVLTELFEAKFTNSVPVEGSQQQQVPQQGATPGSMQMPQQGATPGAMQMPMPQAGGSTNAPQQGINAETRAKIVELTQQAKDFQANVKQQMQQNSYNEALLSERESYRILKEIEELLPKQKNQQQQNQDQQNQQQQNKDQQKQDQKDKKDNKQDQKNKDQQQQQNPKDKQENKKEEEQQSQPKEKKELSDDQVKQLLQKALQREAEHKEEKMKLNESMPLSPYEKDW
jgi:hypothetical protein